MKKWIPEALIIAATPVYGYLLLHFYYFAMESSYNIPISFGRPDFYTSIWIGALVLLLVILSYFLSIGLSLLVPTSKGDPWLIRLRRIIQIVSFTWFGLYFSTFTHGDYFWALQATLAVTTAPVVIFLCIREFIYPLIKFRKTKNKTDRLVEFRSNDVYKTPFTYLRDLIRGSGILILAVPIFISLGVAYKQGIKDANPAIAHDYIIIQSNPKKIVLINYGDRWLTATYEEPSDGHPAYRKEYTIINQDDMSKDKFTVKHIDELWHFN